MLAADRWEPAATIFVVRKQMVALNRPDIIDSVWYNHEIIAGREDECMLDARVFCTDIMDCVPNISSIAAACTIRLHEAASMIRLSIYL